jgi:hypothetical protein
MKRSLSSSIAAAAIFLFAGIASAEIVTPEQKADALRPLASRCGGGTEQAKKDLRNMVAWCARTDFLREMAGADGKTKALLGMQHAGQVLMSQGKETRNDDAYVLGFLLCQKHQVECAGSPKIQANFGKGAEEAASIIDTSTVGRLAIALNPPFVGCEGRNGGIAKIVLEDAGCLAFLRQLALEN